MGEKREIGRHQYTWQQCKAIYDAFKRDEKIPWYLLETKATKRSLSRSLYSVHVRLLEVMHNNQTINLYSAQYSTYWLQLFVNSLGNNRHNYQNHSSGKNQNEHVETMVANGFPPTIIKILKMPFLLLLRSRESYLLIFLKGIVVKSLEKEKEFWAEFMHKIWGGQFIFFWYYLRTKSSIILNAGGGSGILHRKCLLRGLFRQQEQE